MDRTTLEHLDLTMHFVNNKLETDIYDKDIPIYIATKSCHPPQVFESVAKSVGLWLRMKRMEECRHLDRKKWINRPRRNSKSRQPKKYGFFSKWDPRGQNVHEAMGSYTDMKRRWSKHKYDIRQDNWTACGLARHFGNYHRLEVTLLDSFEEEKDLKKMENRWICNMGTLFGGGLNKRNEVLSHRRRNFGGS